MDLVETALEAEGGLDKPPEEEWLEGTGIAPAMIDWPSYRTSIRGCHEPFARWALSPCSGIDRDGQSISDLSPSARGLPTRRAG
jgi:hypothetical protein